MRAKISKAQTEVWEWKEMLYEKTKHLSMSKRIDYLIQKAKDSAGNKKSGKKG
jgi:hypothetical protein